MFHINPESGVPIYRQLVRQIQHAVASGILKPGDRLPTVRRLAASMVINPNTVARAYRELERLGILKSAPGRGTYVAVSRSTLSRKERLERLRPILHELVTEAFTLGFRRQELPRILEEFIRDLPPPPSSHQEDEA